MEIAKYFAIFSMLVLAAFESVQCQSKSDLQMSAATWIFPVNFAIPGKPLNIYFYFNREDELQKLSVQEFSQKVRIEILRPILNKKLQQVSTPPSNGNGEVEVGINQFLLDVVNVATGETSAGLNIGVSDLQYLLDEVPARILRERQVYRLRVNIANSLRFLVKKKFQIGIKFGRFWFTRYFLAISPFIQVKADPNKKFGQDLGEKFNHCGSSISHECKRFQKMNSAMNNVNFDAKRFSKPPTPSNAQIQFGYEVPPIVRSDYPVIN